LVSFALICVVGALLAGWTFLRRRRIAAAAARERAFASQTTRPSLARLGLNPLGQRLVACNVAALVVGILFFSGRGLAIDWSTAWLGPVLLTAILIVWLNFYFVPGAPGERFVAEVLFVTFLMVLLTNVLVPMQYGALAMGAPYADPWLAAADAAMGIHVPAVVAWIWAHPAALRLTNIIYFTFAPQLLLTVFALAALRDRERLWEFAFHFHLCLIVTIAALALWPAVCVSDHYAYKPTVDMTRTIAQIKGFHDGSMTVVRFDDLDGLVSFPSFHVAGGMLVTWAFRHRPRILIPLIVLNIGLAISTVTTGEHYAVDVLGAVPLVAGSLAAYRWWGQSLLAADDVVPQSKAA
jgi:hypothetical protein